MVDVVKYSQSQKYLPKLNGQTKIQDSTSKLNPFGNQGSLENLKRIHEKDEFEIIQSSKTFKGSRILSKLIENAEKQNASEKSNLTLPSINFRPQEAIVIKNKNSLKEKVNSILKPAKIEKEESSKIILEKDNEIIQKQIREQIKQSINPNTPCNIQVAININQSIVNNTVVKQKSEKKINKKSSGCLFFKCFG